MIDQIDNYTAFDLEVGQIGLKWYHWDVKCFGFKMYQQRRSFYGKPKHEMKRVHFFVDLTKGVKFMCEY